MNEPVDAGGIGRHDEGALKTHFIFTLSLLLSLVASRQTHAQAPGMLQRLAALVDYVAADYPGAVDHGVVKEADEYAEQRGLLRDARELATRLAAPRRSGAREQLLALLDALITAVDTKAAHEQVAQRCRAIREVLVNDYDLALVPTTQPSWSRASSLFAANCARCHGADGRAMTEEARRLKPPPVSFHNAERVDRIAPQLAYHALTFGVKDTAMASFDTLPAADRWSLAFYVIALRHDTGHPRDAAQQILARSGFVPTLSRLAELDDLELDQLLLPTVTAAAERALVIDFLRRDVSFAAAPGGTFAVARRYLGELVATTDRQKAHDLAVAAYLEGVEPHEAALRARDAALALRIESAFLRLRHVIDTAADESAIVQEATQLRLLLDRAEERPSSPGVLFLASLTIALREGLETALLIAALLAYLRKARRGEGARLVHLGWLTAIPAGVVTWYFAGALLQGARRELVEAVITLLAAILILGVTHWVLGRLEAQHWLGFLRRKVEDTAEQLDTRLWPLFSLAFFAAYREAVEVVLFYRALLLDAGGHPGAVALGAAAGVGGIVVVLLVIQRLGRRLNPRPVLLTSSVLLALMAVALVGRGVRALQEGGYLALTPFGSVELPLVGVYPTVQTMTAQVLAVLAIVVPALIPARPLGRA